MSKKIPYLDYAILKTVTDNGGASWKSRIHEQIVSNKGRLPAITDVSLQTIGRHVDRLEEHGDLEPCILSPEDVDRQFITGFKVTAQGTEALVEKRKTILKEKVIHSANSLLEPFENSEVEKQALIELMVDEFDLTPETKVLMDDQETEALVSLLAMYYFNSAILDGMDPDNVEQRVRLVMKAPKLREKLFSTSLYDIVLRGLEVMMEEDEDGFLEPITDCAPFTPTTAK